MDDTLQCSEDLLKENEELRSRLREARETLDAIRNGEVDGLLVSTPEGDKVFSLQGADHPYRVFVEQMVAGALTLTEEGMILYCNDRFARMLDRPLEDLIGTSFYDSAVPPEYHPFVDNLIARCVVAGIDAPAAGEARLNGSPGIPVNLSLKRIRNGDMDTLCMVVTDLSEQKRTYEFKTLVENSPDVIMRFDRELRYIYVSPAVVRLAGRPPEFYRGKTLRETVTLFEADRMEELLRRALATGEIVYDELTTILPGSVRYFSLSTVPERGSDGKITSLLCVLHDTTPLRLTEKALQKNVQRLGLLTGTAEELLQSREPQKLAESLCRKVMEHLDCHAFFNYLVDDKAGKLRLNACAGIPGEEAKRIEWLDYGVAVCGCVARDGRRIIAEHIPSTPDKRTELVGSYGIKAYACHPLLTEGGAVIGTLSFGSKTRETFDDEDLSLMKAVADQVATAMARKRVEQDLCESEERFRAVLNSSLDAPYRRDLRTNQYDYMSPAMEQISGFTVEEFSAMGIDEVMSRVHPDDLERMQAELGTVMSSGTSALIEYRFKGKDGGYRWFSDNLTVVREGGTPVYRIGIVRDTTERRKIEEALVESEKRYREIVKFAPAGICEVDFPSRRFTAVNDTMCEMFGYTREELLARGPFDILDEKSRVLLRERAEQWQRGQKPDEAIEYTCRAKNGREARILLNVTFILDDHGRPVRSMIIAHDITERTRMEEQLRRKEEEVRTLIEHSPDIIYRLDTSRRYIFMNSAAERNLGMPAGTFIGHTFEQMGFDERTLALFRRQFEDALASGKEQTIEFVMPVDGDTKHLFSRLIPETGGDGRIVSMLGITSDVTDVKRKEQQLIALNELYRKAKEEYQRLIDTANSIILRWTPDGALKFVNDYGLRFFGYTKKELIGKNAQFLIPDMDSSGKDLGDLALRISREPDTYSYSENENVKKNGERAWVMWTNKAITDEQGNVQEILAIGSDITALKKTQEELRQHKDALETLVEKRTQELLKTHAELERTRRMADIGRLASTIAHELRNPLSGIKTAAYNIQRKSDPCLLGKHIETINKKVQESDLIINNLLGFTRIKTLLHEPFKLLEAVRDCIAGVSAKYAKWNVTVTEEFRCDAEAVIEADFTQMRMLISNLLDNAFQALPDKSGHVSVAVSREDVNYRIAVSDNGTGMSEDEQEKIFEPFYTTKSKGTGLGLTVCQEIVELHGGKIHISSVPGQGTTVTVTIPANQPFPRGEGQAAGQPGVIN